MVGVFAGLIVLPSAVAASEVGGDLTYSRRTRFYEDAGPRAAESQITRLRQEIFWKQEISEGYETTLTVEREDWTLENGAGGNLISLMLEKYRPRFRYSSKPLRLDFSAYLVELDRKPALYEHISTDTRSQFVLPSLGAMYDGSLFFARIIGWREYDVITLDFDRYTFIVTKNILLKGGWRFGKGHAVHGAIQFSERPYPADFGLSREETFLGYRLETPFSQDKMAVWRFFSIELARKFFPASGKTFKELRAENLFRFTTGGVTHFVTYRLTASDGFAAYNRGRTSTAVVEEVVDKGELVQLVKYEGFTRLGGSPFFLAWGIHAEDSLRREAFAERGAHLKLVYTF